MTRTEWARLLFLALILLVAIAGTTVSVLRYLDRPTYVYYVCIGKVSADRCVSAVTDR